ncbi:hypothetical protein CR513_35448, partial [Mucuna pruriens]
MSQYYSKRNCIGFKNLDVNGFNLEIVIIDVITPLQLCEGRDIRLKLYWIKGVSVLEEVKKSFSHDEIRSAIFSVDSFKALGPHGLHLIFFQANWPMIDSSIYYIVRSYYYEPNRINSTLLIFIPKCDAPTSLHQFHPINLCNMIHKIITRL